MAKKIKLLKKAAYTQKEADNNYSIAVEVGSVAPISKNKLKKIKTILAEAKIVRCGREDDFVENISKENLTLIESHLLSIFVRAPKLYNEAKSLLLASYGGWGRDIDLGEKRYFSSQKNWPKFLNQSLGTYIKYVSLKRFRGDSIKFELMANSYQPKKGLSECKSFKLI